MYDQNDHYLLVQLLLIYTQASQTELKECMNGEIMQVITGKFRGRKLETIQSDKTRPTLARVKESLFSMIDEYIPDSVVLDLFAGSGSLGIEALSRGAKKVYFVDNNSIAETIRNQNCKYCLTYCESCCNLYFVRRWMPCQSAHSALTAVKA